MDKAYGCFTINPIFFGSILLKDLPINIQNPIRSLYTDNDRSLWFGTKETELSGYKPMTLTQTKRRFHKALSRISPPPTDYPATGYIASREANSILVSGSVRKAQRLCYYSYKENRIKTIPQQEDTPLSAYIHSICEVNDSTLWLATTGNGLLKVTLRMDKVTPTISKIQTFPLKNGENTCKEIQSMIYDNDSTLFLGGRGGYGVISFNIFNQKYEFLQTNNLRNPAIGDVLSVCQTEILLSMQAPAPDLPD